MELEKTSGLLKKKLVDVLTTDAHGVRKPAHDTAHELWFTFAHDQCPSIYLIHNLT